MVRFNLREWASLSVSSALSWEWRRMAAKAYFVFPRTLNQEQEVSGTSKCTPFFYHLLLIMNPGSLLEEFLSSECCGSSWICQPPFLDLVGSCLDFALQFGFHEHRIHGYHASFHGYILSGMLDTCIFTSADTSYPGSVLHLLTAILLAELVEVQTWDQYQHLGRTRYVTEPFKFTLKRLM